MDIEQRQRVEKNLFHAARPAVEPWDQFKWHLDESLCDTWRPHSSQALCIDLFGTLKTAPNAERDAVLGHLSAQLDLPDAGPWQVELEWEHPANILQERRKTQVDAVAAGADTTILFECKFAERDGGTCSQTIPRRVGSEVERPQCNGNYELQVNPVNGNTAHCALTGKGIRYWEFIPNVFQLNSVADHVPCPFRGSGYQWMRNLVLADAIGKSEARQTTFIIVYADHSNLPFPNTLASPKWAAFVRALRADAVQFHTISYQDLLHIAVAAVGSNNAKWHGLERWVREKIRSVGESRCCGS